MIQKNMKSEPRGDLESINRSKGLVDSSYSMEAAIFDILVETTPNAPAMTAIDGYCQNN